jgi:hypothetical protein
MGGKFLFGIQKLLKRALEISSFLLGVFLFLFFFTFKGQVFQEEDQGSTGLWREKERKKETERGGGNGNVLS